MILLLTGALARGASGRDEFDEWTVEEGLPQNSIQSLLRGRDGYLWLATLDGLVRFDGLKFTIFNRSNSPGLASNSITCMCEDDDGNLWLGLSSGQVARYSQGKFITYGKEDGLTGQQPFSIFSSRRGEVWMLCGDEPIRFQDKWLQGFRPVRWKNGRFDTAVIPEIQRDFDDFWWSARDGAIWCVDQSGFHAFVRGEFRIVLGPEALGRTRILAAHHDRFGDVWILTDDSRLLLARNGSVVRTITSADGLPRTWNSDSQGMRSLLVSEDRSGALWLSGMGLWLARLKDGVFQEFPPPNRSAPHLNGFHRDDDGHLWIATDGGGLLRIREQFIRVYSTPEGLVSANIYPVCEAPDGAIWLGAWNQGLTRIKDGVVTNFTVADGLPYPMVTALHPDREQRLWIGTYGGMRFFRDGVFENAPEPLARPGYVVSAIHQDQKGEFWFGTDLGLWHFTGSDKRLYTTKDGLAGNDIKAIIESPDGALWIAAHGGLTQFRNGAFRSWKEKDGLPSDHIRALYQTDDGALWIGTHDGGLGRLKEDHIDRFTVHDGMFDNGIFQILEDARGFFWMSCNRGIHRVSRRELEQFARDRKGFLTSVAYGRSDGLRNLECNGGRWPAGVKTRDGQLWFPTQDGVAVVNPEAVYQDPRPPTVVIEACLVDRQAAPFDRSVVIPAGTENFEIQYTGLSFVNADRVQFRYRLAGMDRHWVEAGTRRTAYYSHVPHGSYRFTVKAANRDGTWNETGASLIIHVEPHWWQTSWFRVVSAAAIAGLVVGSFELRVRQFKKRRAQQEAFARMVLESQEAERKRIAVELHDGLGQNLLIAVNRAGLGARDCSTAGEARDRLGEVEGLLHDAIHEVRTVSQNLRPAFLERIGLTKSLQAIVKKAAEASTIRFISRIDPIDDLFSPGDDIHVFRLLQEALNNVMRHSHASEAHVYVVRDNGWVVLEVGDNGRGFDPLAAQVPSRLAHGLGLLGMAERVRLLGGTWDCRSEPGRGATLRMRLRVKVPPGDSKFPRDSLPDDGESNASSKET